ncbi:MAG: FxsA family protein [Actinobacteria bacterium]|nr:FxsA family protein [Actinomycetota bacterium]
MLRLLGLFILIPVIEILILVKIGSRVGFWPAIALIVIPGVLGAAMAHSQGLSAVSEIKSDLSAGRLPGNRIIDGILILMGGLLLITPGIITDILGFSVLVPGVRKYYRRVLTRGILARLAARSFKIHMR